jgi:hypothetical protein
MQTFTRRQNPITGRNQFAAWREAEREKVTLAIWHTESVGQVYFSWAWPHGPRQAGR